ncbi:MAG: hypothetical protein HY695_15955 [Deltaproteobacteria bacterium]|nr:hypothetical protein [Deltaproteobacteria bacterium]
MKYLVVTFGKGLLRLTRRYLKGSRPSSYPYISGDSFRKIADHVYDETKQAIDVQRMRPGDTVFVPTHFVPQFFDTVHPYIHTTYKLITHNSDNAVDEELVKYIDSRILRWYAQNNSVAHPLIVPIPIGLENFHHCENGIVNRFNRLRRQKARQQKLSRALVCFAVHTNRIEREVAYRVLMSNGYCDEIRPRLNNNEYLQHLIHYKFVVAPPGNGLDTHRVWEAMYLGVVPIVKRSVAMSSFETLGLPLWVIDDWRELETINDDGLDRKWQELHGHFDAPMLFMDYWVQRIRENF